MGFLDGITKSFKSMVKDLSKVADVVGPICSFIPGLNPTVTVACAAIKAADGLTDNPPNMNKVFEGAMGLIPGGTLGKVLGPLNQMGGGTSMDIAKMIGEAAAGKSGTGGLLGEMLTQVLADGRIGGKDSELGRLATSVLGGYADKMRTGDFNRQLAEALNLATGTKAGDLLTSDQVVEALSRYTGGQVTRNIDGEVRQVPEQTLVSQYMRPFENAGNTVSGQYERNRDGFDHAPVPPRRLFTTEELRGMLE